MEKIWIECQRCGSVFWVFADELNAIYPKIELTTRYVPHVSANLIQKNSA